MKKLMRNYRVCCNPQLVSSVEFCRSMLRNQWEGNESAEEAKDAEERKSNRRCRSGRGGVFPPTAPAELLQAEMLRLPLAEEVFDVLVLDVLEEDAPNRLRTISSLLLGARLSVTCCWLEPC